MERKTDNFCVDFISAFSEEAKSSSSNNDTL